MKNNHSRKKEYLPIQKASDLKSATKSLSKKFFHLEEHIRRNKDTSHMNYKIYYLLCNPYTFVHAYAKIRKNGFSFRKGALSKEIDQEEQTIFFFGKSNAKQIAKKFKTNTYKWKPIRSRMAHCKAQGTGHARGAGPVPKIQRPIETPTQEDRIVQEAVRGILEAIFEPEFEGFEKSTKFLSTNFGFRPKKSTWDAVKNLKYLAQHCNIGIEGDIKSAYNSIHPTRLLTQLEKRIRDKRFLKLIRDLLQSGILDVHREHQGEYTHSLTGTSPEGGTQDRIVSPLLLNIYMFNLDKYIYEKIVAPIYQNPPQQKPNPEYKNILYQESQILKKLKTTSLSLKQRKSFMKEYKKLRQKRQNLSTNIISTTPKAAVFSRYGDDWVLLITSTHQKALEYKTQIAQYIQTYLFMELDKEKTLITPIKKGIPFLGFTIIKWSKNQWKKRFVLQNRNQKVRSLKQTTSNKINILPDKNRLRRNLILRNFCQPNLNPIGKRGLAKLDEFEIVLKYRQIMLGILEYYINCDNNRILNQVSYILQYSCAKTLATRQKTTISKIFKKYTTKMNIKKALNSKGQTITKQINFPTLAKAKKFGKLIPKKEKSYENKDPFYIQGL